MYVMYEEVARQRVREAHEAAAVHRLVRQAQSARSAARWHRLAAWAEHRSVRYQEQNSETPDPAHRD